ncbi:MAG: hypothetical protein ACRDGP_02980 [Actinomycetota bacterium]
MSAVVAHGGFVGGDSPWMLIWFGLFVLGIVFIAIALRDDRKGQKDDSIRDLQDLRDLPLRNVREAIRPKPAPRTPDPTDGPRPRAARGPRGPRGLVR